MNLLLACWKHRKAMKMLFKTEAELGLWLNRHSERDAVIQAQDKLDNTIVTVGIDVGGDRWGAFLDKYGQAQTPHMRAFAERVAQLQHAVHAEVNACMDALMGDRPKGKSNIVQGDFGTWHPEN